MAINAIIMFRFPLKSSWKSLLKQQKLDLSINSNLFVTRKKQIDEFDLKNQSIEIDPIERIRRSPIFKDIDIWSYYKSIHPHIRTMGDILDHGQSVSNDGPCLGFLQLENKSKPIHWLSYSMVSQQARSIGSYLWTEKKLVPMNSKVAILSINRSEYPIVQYGCFMYGFIVVNLYLSYDTKTIINLLEKTHAEVLVVDELERIRSFENYLFETDRIKEIIVMGQVNIDRQRKIESFCSILNKMKSIEIRQRPSVDSQSIAYFLLTSGTTGDPKLAMLTHENFLAGLKSMIEYEERVNILLKPSDRHCSFLPMAHLYEQAVMLIMLTSGCQIISCPTTDQLLEYYKIFKPTRIYIVPRILNKLYDKIMTEVNQSQMKRFLVSYVLRRDEPSFLSRLIFRKVKQIFGGEISSLVSASAPISRDVFNFFRISLDVPIYEVFGQTESTGVNTATHILDKSGGTVGTPMCTVEIKLIDVIGTDYSSRNNQGEICIRGPIVFKGYYDDEVKTRETVDEQGWLHTGDIGEWTPNGCLRLIDRRKHIFKLSQGKYIAPERLEEIYIRSPWISQIYVDGLSTEATVVAIVVPNEEYIRYKLKTTNEKTFEDMCKSDKLKHLIINDLIRLAKINKLKYYETVSQIHLHHQNFTQENGLLTSTLKIKRTVARKRFEQIIKSLYDLPVK